MLGKHDSQRPLQTPSHTWEDNIKMDLQETGWEDVAWIHLAQDRDKWWSALNMAMNLQVP